MFIRSYVRGVSMRMCYVRVIYDWRMKRTRDVSMAFPLRSILICGVSVLYQLRVKKTVVFTLLMLFGHCSYK